MIRHSKSSPNYRLTGQSLHLDFPLLGLILSFIALGFIILYSASGEHLDLLERQGLRLILALFILILFAFTPPININNGLRHFI